MPPEGVPLTLEIAPLGARFGAQLLDLLLTGGIALAIVVLLSLAAPASASAIELIGWLFFLFVRTPYYVAAELVWNGQTLGKRLRRLRVVSADGRRLRPYAIAVRNVMKELEVFAPGTALVMIPVMSPAGYIVLVVWILVLLAVPLCNRRRQRLGDMVAGTYVIRLPRTVLMPDVAARAEGAAARFSFRAHQLDHYGAYELQTLERALQLRTRRLDRASAERHRRNLAAIADNIQRKIGFTEPVAPNEVPTFLEAFYLAQRRHLETRKLFGDERADQFHEQAPRQQARRLPGAGEDGRS